MTWVGYVSKSSHDVLRGQPFPLWNQTGPSQAREYGNFRLKYWQLLCFLKYLDDLRIISNSNHLGDKKHVPDHYCEFSFIQSRNEICDTNWNSFAVTVRSLELIHWAHNCRGTFWSNSLHFSGRRPQNEAWRFARNKSPKRNQLEMGHFRECASNSYAVFIFLKNRCVSALLLRSSFILSSVLASMRDIHQNRSSKIYCLHVLMLKLIWWTFLNVQGIKVLIFQVRAEFTCQDESRKWNREPNHPIS
jgi:hypothetical protein